jgi:hypothetical protein
MDSAQLAEMLAEIVKQDHSTEQRVRMVNRTL